MYFYKIYIFSVIFYTYVYTKLIIKPQNATIVRFDMCILSCQSDTYDHSNIYWDYYKSIDDYNIGNSLSIYNSQLIDVYNGLDNSIYYQLQLFKRGIVNLMITGNGDISGIYVCREIIVSKGINLEKDRGVAYVTVIVRWPVMNRVNLNNDGINVGCEISYKGYSPPLLKLRSNLHNITNINTFIIPNNFIEVYTNVIQLYKTVIYECTLNIDSFSGFYLEGKGWINNNYSYITNDIIIDGHYISNAKNTIITSDTVYATNRSIISNKEMYLNANIYYIVIIYRVGIFLLITTFLILIIIFSYFIKKKKYYC